MTFKAVMLASALVLTASACSPRIQRSYEIEVGLDTPQGLRTGHGVIRLEVVSLDRSKGHRRPKVVGEAVPIKLSAGKYAFMLVDMPSRGWEVYAPWVSDENIDSLESGAKVPMATEMIPGFAYFTDMKDPHSVKEFKINGFMGGISPVSIKYINVSRSDLEPSHYTSRLLSWLNRDNSRSSAINPITIRELRSLEKGVKPERDSFQQRIDYSNFKRTF